MKQARRPNNLAQRDYRGFSQSKNYFQKLYDCDYQSCRQTATSVSNSRNTLTHKGQVYNFNSFLFRLFKENPELLQMFSFRDINTNNNSTDDAMRTDDRLKRQGLVTMQHVDLAVASLNDLGSIVPALKDLGARHSMYKVEEHHFAV